MIILTLNCQDSEEVEYMLERIQHAARLHGEMPFFTINEKIHKIHNFVSAVDKFKVDTEGLIITLTEED